MKIRSTSPRATSSLRFLIGLTSALALATSAAAKTETPPLPAPTPVASITPAHLGRLDLRAGEPSEVAADRNLGRLKVIPTPEATKKTLTSRAVVDAAGSSVGGEILAGSFELEYRPDPADRAVVFENLERSAAAWGSLKGKTERTDEAIRFRVSEALILAAGVATAGNAPGEPLELAKELRRLHWDGPLPRIFAAHAAGRSGAAAILARGQGFLILHVVDPLVGRESIAFYAPAIPAPSGLEGWSVETLLDSRPLGGSRRNEPPEPLELRAVDVTLTAIDDDHARLTTQLELAARKAGERAIVLEFPEARIRVRSSGRAEIQPNRVLAVRSGGAELAFVHEGGILWVDPGRILAAGEAATIEIQAEIPLYRPNFENYWLLGRDAWYPRPRRVAPEAFRFAATIVPPKAETPFSSGQRASGEPYRAQTTRAIRYPAIAAGHFKDVTAATKNLPTQTLGVAKKTEAKRVDQAAGAMLELYRRIFGPEPMATTALLDVTSQPWGSPVAGIVPLAGGAFDGILRKITAAEDEAIEAGGLADADGGLDSVGLGPTDPFYLSKRQFERNERELDPPGFPPFPRGTPHRLAHELAHLWWGQTFRLASEDDRWLEESIAEYMAGYALEKLDGKKPIGDLVAAWTSRSHAVPAGIPLIAAERVVGKDSSRLRMDLLAGRGPLLLHTLRMEIGDDAFLTTLRSFLKSFDGKVARSDDFAGLLGAVTRKDWRPWLERHVIGAEPPPEVADR